jgi:hypothetical protein
LTLTSAESAKVVLVLFHHKAPHNSRVFPTRQKGVGSGELEKRLLDIVDWVFWQGAFYDCDTNARAEQEMIRAMTLEK